MTLATGTRAQAEPPPEGAPSPGLTVRPDARMDDEAVRLTIEAFKKEGIDLVVTLPEEPTYSLTEAIRQDPYFTAVTAASEGSGIAFCGGASLAGRPCVFVTGVAGLLVGTWALSQLGKLFGAPILILASYRGDFGDRTGIPGAQLRLFRQMAEPLLKTLDFPYMVVSEKSQLPEAISNGFFAAQNYGVPVVLLLTGHVVTK